MAQYPEPDWQDEAQQDVWEREPPPGLLIRELIWMARDVPVGSTDEERARYAEYVRLKREYNEEAAKFGRDLYAMQMQHLKKQIACAERDKRILYLQQENEKLQKRVAELEEITKATVADPDAGEEKLLAMIERMLAEEARLA